MGETGQTEHRALFLQKADGHNGHSGHSGRTQWLQTRGCSSDTCGCKEMSETKILLKYSIFHVHWCMESLDSGMSSSFIISRWSLLPPHIHSHGIPTHPPIYPLVYPPIQTHALEYSKLRHSECDTGLLYVLFQNILAAPFPLFHRKAKKCNKQAKHPPTLLYVLKTLIIGSVLPHFSYNLPTLLKIMTFKTHQNRVKLNCVNQAKVLNIIISTQGNAQKAHSRSNETNF